MPTDSSKRARSSWAAVVVLIGAVIALIAWHAPNVRWIRWRSNSSIIDALHAAPHSVRAFDLEKELRRRFQAGTLTEYDMDTLAAHALEALAASSRHMGGPSWPDSILTTFFSAGKLSTAQFRTYCETKLKCGGIALGLFNEGLPTRQDAGVLIALRDVYPAHYRVELVPDNERVQTDGKKYRLLGTGPFVHVFTSIRWSGREPADAIDVSVRIRATPDSTPTGKALWEGVLQFSSVAWPARNLPMRDAAIVAGKLLHSSFDPSEEPK